MNYNTEIKDFAPQGLARPWGAEFLLAPLGYATESIPERMIA